MLDIIWTILFLVVCSITDIKERKINLWFCIANTIGMIIAHILCQDYNGWNAVEGIVIMGVFFLINKFLKEAIGIGDVFMIMTIGIVCGAIYIIEILFLSSIMCSVFSCVGVVLGKLSLKSKLPFAPFMLMGAVVLAINETIIIFCN